MMITPTPTRSVTPKPQTTVINQLKQIDVPASKNNQEAAQELINAGMPVTKANIEAAKKQLGLQ